MIETIVDHSERALRGIIARQAACIQELERQLADERELRAQLMREVDGKKEWTPPWSLKLTPREADVLCALMKYREPVSRERLLVFFTCAPDRRAIASDSRDDKIVDIYIMRVRRKLEPLHLVIKNYFGRGWVLDPLSRHRLLAMTEEAV